MPRTYKLLRKIVELFFFSQDNNSFSIGKMINHNESVSYSDLETLKKNKISITPLLLNLTNNIIINNLKIS